MLHVRQQHIGTALDVLFTGDVAVVAEGVILAGHKDAVERTLV